MDILIFIGAFVVVMVYTGLWKIILPIYAIGLIAFLISEKRNARVIPAGHS
jgi:hypothetical protein